MTDFLEPLRNWRAPDHWIRLLTVDAHTAGEPLRIIVAGYPELQGKNILELRRHARESYDKIRTILMWEPRGHADMYGCVVVPPVSAEADFGIIFMHNEGYSSMCGHGIIAITKVVVETGLVKLVEPETVVRIDTPSGLVTSYAEIPNGRVSRVRFQNVPSYVVELDATVEVEGIGEVPYDLAFGGAYYAYVDAERLGLSLNVDSQAELIRVGMMIKRAVVASRKIEHPFEADLGFLYGTIFVGPPTAPDSHSRNVCIFAEGEVDRSPTGTGVSGRMAIHHARGEVKIGQPCVIESIIGSRFSGRVVEETTFGDYAAVIPEVSGTAFITGRHQFLIDPEDPLAAGFILR